MADRAPLPYDYLPKVASFSLESTDVADGQMLGGRRRSTTDSG